MRNLCYCGSKLSFEECCKPIIEGTKFAPTAQALMRSRYSAYVIIDAQYIIDSTSIATRGNQSKTEIEAWAKICTWQKLEIISAHQGLEKDLVGEVEFKAHFIDVNKNPQIHHEKSVFNKTNGKWFFVNGNIIVTKENDNLSTDRNASCPCGSGKKFKKCCGT